MLTRSPSTGKPLIGEPAVFGAELINEDSYLFWTFASGNIPDAELRIVETQFGDWLKQTYGTLDKALAAWNGQREPRDHPDEGRIAFRPIWNMFNEKTARDKDTVRFLVESQRRFYEETYRFLRELGLKGLDYRIELDHGRSAGARAAGKIQLYCHRFHRPPRLLWLQHERRIRVVGPRRIHIP